MVELTKIHFITSIDLMTPSCAIVDIASDYNLSVQEIKLTDPSYRSHVINQIAKRKPHCVDPLCNKSLPYIAHYINPDKTIKWSKSILLERFKTTQEIISGKEGNFKVGYSTPEIFMVTPAIAVGMLKRRNVRLTSQLSIDDLTALIEFCTLSQSEQMNMIIQKAMTVQPVDMTIILSKSNNIQTWVGWDKYKVKRYILNGIDNIVYPTNPAAATAIAAVKYRVDISSSNNPMEELRALSTGKFPVDARMCKVIRLNSRAFNLMFFNPIFPYSFYTDSEMSMLKQRNNITIVDSEEVYGNLMVKYRTNGFYRSVHPEVTDFQTPIRMYDYEQLTPRTPLVCYGSNGKYHIYRVKEITTTFDNYELFSLGGDYPITMSAVKDLRNIIKSMVDQRQLLPKEKAEWSALQSTIDRINRTFSKVDFHGNMFSEYCTDERFEDAKDILWTLFELSLYMRGWDGKSVWPISESQIPKFTDANYEAMKNKADSNSQKHMKLFKSKCTGPIGEHILNLPLIRMYNGHWQISTDFFQGNTISERIKIVDDNFITFSCTGLSSNWLLSTAYYYLDCIDETPDCDIKKMKHVTETVTRK